MTIRPGQPPAGAATKPSSQGMDVVMASDLEQRHHHAAKSRSHSPFGHIGSPTTPLNFEQLFQLNSELSQHDQNVLQAQLLNTMRINGMGSKPKQQSQPSQAMLDQRRHAYNRGEQEAAFSRGDAEWGARQHPQQQQQQHEAVTEPLTIALLQQKFAQLERHKAEMHNSPQLYPTQWPMPASSMPPPPPLLPQQEPRHFAPGFYSFQPPQSLPDTPDQFKPDLAWRSAPAPTPQPWSHPPAAPQELSPLVYMTPPPPAPLHSRTPEFAPPYSGYPLSAASSRCDKTGGHTVDLRPNPDPFRSDDSEMSLDNFSARSAPPVSFAGSGFHMLPQSSKSAFTTFTRASSNLNPVVTKSLLFTDAYRMRSHEVPDAAHDDVDTELHL